MDGGAKLSELLHFSLLVSRGGSGEGGNNEYRDTVEKEKRDRGLLDGIAE